MANDINALQGLLRRLQAEYADDPNIVSVGFGLRNRGGKLETERAIIFFVRQKYPSVRQIEAAGSRPIPPEIEGFPTDVQQFNPRVRAAVGHRDDQHFDPLLGGPTTANAEEHIFWFNGYGTLGLLVHDATDGTEMALSNWHVYADGGEEGDDIIQPAHPTTGDHVEAITKVLACGPLVTSLIEWEVPDPLTAGLYGGAAGAAIAAAASDYRDPTRRGQDATPTAAGQLTNGELVEMAIEYPQLPLPGIPFKADVKWRYERLTSQGVMTHAVEETRTNTQFLLGKMVVTDKSSYGAGNTVKLTAAVWDYQPRSCDAYHVVAHLIPHLRPTTAIRVVLHPATCPRTFPQEPEGELVCVSFEDSEVGPHPYKGTFAWLGYLDPSQQPVLIVDWFEPYKAVQISQRGLLLHHQPASKVVARVAQFTNTPISLVARNSAGTVLDQITAPAQQGVVHELTLNGNGIVDVMVRGGGGEGLLISYCIAPLGAEVFTTGVTGHVIEGIRFENPRMALANNSIKSKRCCFTGTIDLPPDEPPGKWDVYLTVQNVNDVPQGTPPEEAATTIGGHVLSAHSEALGCTAIMLLDHVFDVI